MTFAGPVASGTTLDYSSSTAVTPPDVAAATGGGVSQPAAPALVLNQQAELAASGLAMGPAEAHWLRDLYLGLGVAVGVLFVGSRLAQAFT